MKFEEIAAEVRKGREFRAKGNNYIYRFSGIALLYRNPEKGPELVRSSNGPGWLLMDDFELLPMEVTKYQWLIRDIKTGLVALTAEYFENERQANEYLCKENFFTHHMLGPCRESAKQFNKI